MSLEMRPSQMREDTLEDADKNTKVMTEKNPNENKIRFDTNSSERMIIDETGNVGIGTDNPTEKLDVNGIIKSSELKTAQISDTNSNNAITVEDGGYLKFNKGVKSSRGVHISATSTGGFYNKWIKIAETTDVGDHMDTATSVFLITMVGESISNVKSMDGTFIVQVKYTAKSTTPYYYAIATTISVTPLGSRNEYGYAARGTPTTWNPTNSIFITSSDSSLTGVVELWLRVPLRMQHVFVSQIAGTTLADTSETDPAFVILSGQSYTLGQWASGTPTYIPGDSAYEPAGLGWKVFGTWVSTRLNDIQVTGSVTIENSSVPASATASGTKGTITWGDSYVYVCTDTDEWKRAALVTW